MTNDEKKGPCSIDVSRVRLSAENLPAPGEPFAEKGGIAGIRPSSSYVSLCLLESSS